MEYILILIIVLCVSAYICYPFFIKSSNEVLFEEEKKDYSERKKGELEMLEDDKLELYSAIKEIDFDYEMGKLSDEDYKQLRQNYVYDAAQVLKQIEKYTNESDKSVVDELEQEMKMARHEVKTKEDELELEIKKQSKKKG